MKMATMAQSWTSITSIRVLATDMVHYFKLQGAIIIPSSPQVAEHRALTRAQLVNVLARDMAAKVGCRVDEARAYLAMHDGAALPSIITVARPKCPCAVAKHRGAVHNQPFTL